MENKINLNKRQEITLPMILDQFSEKDHKLIWSIFYDADVFGDFEPEGYLEQVITHIREGKKKLIVVTWDELYEMAKQCTVVINLKLIGCKGEKISQEIVKAFHELNSYPLPTDILPLYEILVDIDDGELRAVLSKDKEIEERCFKKFGPYPVGVYRDIEE